MSSTKKSNKATKAKASAPKADTKGKVSVKETKETKAAMPKELSFIQGQIEAALFMEDFVSGEPAGTQYRVYNVSLRLKNIARRMILNYQASHGDHEAIPGLLQQAKNPGSVTGVALTKANRSDPDPGHTDRVCANLYDKLEEKGYLKNPFVLSKVQVLLGKSQKAAERISRGGEELETLMNAMK